MSKRLNKRQQREAEELAELQRAQASVRPEVDEDEEAEQSAELNANKEEEEDDPESEVEEEQPTRKSAGKVLNPFAAVSQASGSLKIRLCMVQKLIDGTFDSLS
jgi:hypothetical protein